MIVKRRVTLHPGVPLSLVSSSPGYRDSSITLTAFSIDANRVTWQITTGDGKIIEGRAKGQQPLPNYPDSWIALAIPLKIHVRERVNAPDFVIGVPGSIK